MKRNECNKRKKQQPWREDKGEILRVSTNERKIINGIVSVKVRHLLTLTTLQRQTRRKQLHRHDEAKRYMMV